MGKQGIPKASSAQPRHMFYGIVKMDGLGLMRNCKILLMMIKGIHQVNTDKHERATIQIFLSVRIG